MNKPNRLPSGEENQLPRELDELAVEIAKLPVEYREKMEIAYASVTESFGRRRRILNLVQEALSQLRLDVKYLMFDLEVTKSERNELKIQLEEENF